jgi:uncharacterized membrane protein
MRSLAWAIMTMLAIAISLYAFLVMVSPTAGPPFVRERLIETPWAVYSHFTGSLWALAVGPWQLNRRFRERAWLRHRWLGRSYVAGVGIGAIGAFALVPRVQTGAVAALGFGALGVLWSACTLAALLSIRAGEQEAHRRWMIRSYALTLAAVTLRIYLPVSIAAGVDFTAAYPVIAWACWVPNLLVAELWFNRRGRLHLHHTLAS